MLDHPRGPSLLDAVARLLREVLLPQLPAGSSAAFQARVAANAVDLVARAIAPLPRPQRHRSFDAKRQILLAVAVAVAGVITRQPIRRLR